MIYVRVQVVSHRLARGINDLLPKDLWDCSLRHTGGIRQRWP